MVTVFPVNEPAILAILVLGIVAVLIIVGVVLAIFSLIGKKKRTQILVAGIVMLISGAGVFFVSNPSHPNSIATGTGSVLVSASPYFNLNVSASQISKAYVVSLSSWNVHHV